MDFDTLNKMFGPTEDAELKAEVKALRKEIQQLRWELNARPSDILLGREVIAEFKKLLQKG